MLVVIGFVVVIIVGHKNLTLKFGQNWADDKISEILLLLSYF